MNIDRRVIERVEKLLRLAAPTSGTTEHERISAALAAAKLFSENNLSVQESVTAKPKISRARRPNVRPRPESGQPPGFYPSIASRDADCYDCGRQIAAGSAAWERRVAFGNQYIHMRGDCGW